MAETMMASYRKTRHDSVKYIKLKGNAYKTKCRLYLKEGNKPGCLVHENRAIRLEDMAVERFNNGYLGTSHMTGYE